MISRVGPSGGEASDTGASAELSGSAPNTSSSLLAEGLGVDVADHRDHKLVAGEDAADIILELVGADGFDRGHGALDGAAVRVIAEGEPVPGERGDLLGIVLIEFQAGDDLSADAFDGVGIEARRRQREAQQIEGFVSVGRQHLDIAEHDIAARVEVHAHGERLQAVLEVDGVEVARALVHHAGDEIGDAVLADRVLSRAAAKGEAHGDQRIVVALDEPSLDAARALDALDLHGVSRRRRKRRSDSKRGREEDAGRAPSSRHRG